MTVNNDIAESAGSAEQGSGAAENENFQDREETHKNESFTDKEETHRNENVLGKEENSEPNKSFIWSPGTTPGGELICDLCPDLHQVTKFILNLFSYF